MPTQADLRDIAHGAHPIDHEHHGMPAPMSLE